MKKSRFGFASGFEPVKKMALLAVALTLTGTAVAQTNEADYKAAISAVFQARIAARQAALVIVPVTNILTKAQLNERKRQARLNPNDPYHYDLRAIPKFTVTHKQVVFLPKYVPALMKIDISQCPEDFRGAWADYIAALELKWHPDADTKQLQRDAKRDKSQTTGGSIGLAGGVPAIGVQHSQDTHAEAQDLMQMTLQQDPTQQWLKVQKIAMEKYGVSLAP